MLFNKSKSEYKYKTKEVTLSFNNIKKFSLYNNYNINLKKYNDYKYILNLNDFWKNKNLLDTSNNNSNLFSKKDKIYLNDEDDLDQFIEKFINKNNIIENLQTQIYNLNSSLNQVKTELNHYIELENNTLTKNNSSEYQRQYNNSSGMIDIQKYHKEKPNIIIKEEEDIKLSESKSFIIPENLEENELKNSDSNSNNIENENKEIMESISKINKDNEHGIKNGNNTSIPVPTFKIPNNNNFNF